MNLFLNRLYRCDLVSCRATRSRTTRNAAPALRTRFHHGPCQLNAGGQALGPVVVTMETAGCRGAPRGSTGVGGVSPVLPLILVYWAGGGVNGLPSSLNQTGCKQVLLIAGVTEHLL